MDIYDYMICAERCKFYVYHRHNIEIYYIYIKRLARTNGTNNRQNGIYNKGTSREKAHEASGTDLLKASSSSNTGSTTGNSSSTKIIQGFKSNTSDINY